MLQLLPNNNCMNSKGRVSTLLLNTLECVTNVSTLEYRVILYHVGNQLNILASTLNSPITVGHNNSLEPTLILIILMWATLILNPN